jgi:hypothetical protein
MSEPPFDPDATIDERRYAAASVGVVEPPTAPTDHATPPHVPPAIAPELAGDAGNDTVDEWRPRHGTARPDPPGGDTVDEKRPATLLPCPHCRNMIDARAVICPSCRKPTGKRAVPQGLVVTIAAAVIILVVLYFVWDCVGGK